MDCSTPVFPVLHYFLEFAQTHVHWVNDAIQPSHPVTSFSSCLQSIPASGSFPLSQPFTSGGQSIGASASASVLPMNIQGWFLLGWTGLISLLSKGFSRVFSNTTVQNHQFFASGGQSIGSSASASVLPMNIQGWFPLQLTGLISLQSKGLSTAPQLETINSSALSLLYNGTPIQYSCLENPMDGGAW